MYKSFSLLLCFFVIGQCSLVFADITTDRPDFTESPEIVPLKSLQVEGGYTISKTGSETEQAIGEILIRHPIIKNFEFRLGVNSYKVSSLGSGMEDTVLGIKTQVIEGKSWVPNTAFIFQTSIPTGALIYRVNSFQPGIKLAMGWDLTETTAFSTNINYSVLASGGTSFSQGAVSFSLGHSFNDSWGGYLEYFGFFPEDISSGSAQYLNTGITYLITSNYQFDVRAGLNIARQSDFFVGIGLSNKWEF